ncbi:MAG: SNF2-related protein [Chitinophagaceae bacterium]|jgi:superfamily II DNA or RNA helicase
MSLSHLLKFVYNNGTDEVIRRGKKIHAIGYVEFVEHDELMGSVTFRVKDDNYSTFYKVHVQKYKDPRALSLRCTCPYNLGDICRHEAAALLQLQDLVDRNMIGGDAIRYDQKHTVIKMKLIDLKTIRLLATPEVCEKAEVLLRTNKVSITSAKDERVEGKLELNGETFALVLQRNEERNFDSSCKCTEVHHPICLHKTMLLLQLLNAYGSHYFDSIRNWDKEKNKLLGIYGYSMNDADWEKKFEFSYKDGKPFLRVLDPTVKRVTTVPEEKVPAWKKEEKKVDLPVEVEATVLSSQRLGMVLVETPGKYPGFLTELVVGEFDEDAFSFVGKVQQIDLSKYIATAELSPEDSVLLAAVRKLQRSEIDKYVSRNSPFSGIWENIIYSEEEGLPAETTQLIDEYIYPKLIKIFSDNSHRTPLFLLKSGKSFTTANLQQLQIGKGKMKPGLKIGSGKKQIEIEPMVFVEEWDTELAANQWSSLLMTLFDGSVYMWESLQDLESISAFFPERNRKISNKEWPAFLESTVLPFARQYKVDFDKSLLTDLFEGTPDIRLLLQEKNEYLIFIPVFVYQGYEVKAGDKEVVYIPDGPRIRMIRRDIIAERAFIKKLSALHSNFIQVENSFNLVLKGSDVLKNNWFFLFIDAMKDSEVPVLGFEELRNFRFNTAKPQTRIQISNGVDWFDAKVDIVFGNQKVTIEEIKRALTNKQQFVQLNDGTLGILPENWLKKYSLFFRVGEGKQDQLRLSKYHLSVIDELYNGIDETEVMIKLEERYERLRSFNRINEVDPPSELSHVLRPYQVAGYHWLNYLTEVGWGGILADDMGLGKTVQALSCLQLYKEKNGKMSALVICPTTLMFNWENEIKKFTPKLTYRIHHGGERERDKSIFQKYDVVITTYGTLRSDIKFIVDNAFDYVVLDESQAIKNPQSKVTKAACLLNAKNRLCMSGTPLQNNTFDIYAQMNFLNPGMLGSMEYFRNEFATPIDKFGEKEHKDHLRKLLYPFILRRTKEQVAKDLPDKTETIIFCEMEEEQRNIYDAYRNDYRDKILGVIKEQGIDKSQLTILQGLMKLRQICDSPAIMNEKDQMPNVSVKLDELSREITENIGNHKALVFSQFLGMLALIRDRLTELGVKYEYFDGSTTATERERAIQSFQNNDEIRVFLISLKAGGVGLNLTAADYVYIVDPWWNPAVEQQAIDRTHRIGQTKNIFAYRMICKDTIEDKILQLQEKKRNLARDLVADDTGFVKSLTREDVEYLFS